MLNDLMELILFNKRPINLHYVVITVEGDVVEKIMQGCPELGQLLGRLRFCSIVVNGVGSY